MKYSKFLLFLVVGGFLINPLCASGKKDGAEEFQVYENGGLVKQTFTHSGGAIFLKEEHLLWDNDRTDRKPLTDPPTIELLKKNTHSTITLGYMWKNLKGDEFTMLNSLKLKNLKVLDLDLFYSTLGDVEAILNDQLSWYGGLKIVCRCNAEILKIFTIEGAMCQE